jgi:hypothetical protein
MSKGLSERILNMKVIRVFNNKFMQKGILKKDDKDNTDENNWNLFSEIDAKFVINKKPKKLVEKMYNNARQGNMKKTVKKEETKNDEEVIEDYKKNRFGRNKK